MDLSCFDLLPGMDTETFENWCAKRGYTENDLIFIFKSVRYKFGYVPEKITTKDVAARLQKSEQYVRICLQQGKFPFGTAMKMPGGERYNYIIYPEKFRAYCGEIERGAR